MNILKDITVQRFSDDLEAGMSIHVGQVIMENGDGNKTYMLDDDVVIHDVDEESLRVKYGLHLITIHIDDVLNGAWEISEPKSK